MRESCFGSGTQGKQDCYEYHQGRTEVNMRQKKRDGEYPKVCVNLQTDVR